MADGAEGLEPLHTAALQGHADVVQMILDQGFDINTVVFKTKQSALHIASDKGHIQIVTLLTSRGSWPCRLCQGSCLVPFVFKYSFVGFLTVSLPNV